MTFYEALAVLATALALVETTGGRWWAGSFSFRWYAPFPPLQRGARGDFPALGVPKSPQPPLRKGERNEN